jgi:hypothetical protein
MIGTDVTDKKMLDRVKATIADVIAALTDGALSPAYRVHVVRELIGKREINPPTELKEY